MCRYTLSSQSVHPHDFATVCPGTPPAGFPSDDRAGGTCQYCHDSRVWCRSRPRGHPGRLCPGGGADHTVSWGTPYHRRASGYGQCNRRITLQRCYSQDGSALRLCSVAYGGTGTAAWDAIAKFKSHWAQAARTQPSCRIVHLRVARGGDHQCAHRCPSCSTTRLHTANTYSNNNNHQFSAWRRTHADTPPVLLG